MDRGRGQGAWIGGVERWRGQVAGIGVLRGDGDRGVDRGRGEGAGTGGGDRGAVGGDRGVQPMSRRGMLLDTRCVNRLTGNLSTRLSAE